MPMFAVLALDPDRRDALKQLAISAFEISSSTLQVFASDLPVQESDPVVRDLKERQPDIVLVDIAPQRAAVVMASIELIHAEVPRASIVAIGDLQDTPTVVGAMRSGACEFLPRTCTAEDLSRSVAELRPATKQGARSGRVITVVNAKGGCGATTVAVNMAVSLQKEHGKCVVVDLAPLGHAALQLNANPSFGIATVLRSLGRLDQSLLEGILTQTECGLDLLAGMEPPLDADIHEDGLRRLIDLLADSYRFVVIDASSRLDPMLRSLCDCSDLVLLVADANTLALLWSAARVQRYLAGERSGYDKVQLVLNRYDRGFPLSDTDAEAATDARVLWKIPSEALVVGPSVDIGVPVVLKKNSEAGKSIRGLASAVADLLQNSRRPATSFAEQPGSTFLSYMSR